jgi:O-methyltransferase involved in polyketide biosynthesis
MPGSERISPTAHYTAYVWYVAGMSHPALTTGLGRMLYTALRPMNVGYEQLGHRPSLDQMLLARHRVLDHLLEHAIQSGRVGQVIEVAAGLSPRGFSFAARHPRLVYLEADLPDMAAIKRRRLAEAGLGGPRHRVLEVDALRDDGPESLPSLAAAHLDPAVGTAVITEGLVGYFDRPSVEGMWTRFARVLSRFPHGVYLADLHLARDTAEMRLARTFRLLLSAFARGKVHLHFADDAEAVAALSAAGFARPVLHRAGEVPGVEVPGRERGHVVRLIEAWVAANS